MADTGSDNNVSDYESDGSNAPLFFVSQAPPAAAAAASENSTRREEESEPTVSADDFFAVPDGVRTMAAGLDVAEASALSLETQIRGVCHDICSVVFCFTCQRYIRAAPDEVIVPRTPHEKKLGFRHLVQNHMCPFCNNYRKPISSANELITHLQAVRTQAHEHVINKRCFVCMYGTCAQGASGQTPSVQMYASLKDLKRHFGTHMIRGHADFHNLEAFDKNKFFQHGVNKAQIQGVANRNYLCISTDSSGLPIVTDAYCLFLPEYAPANGSNVFTGDNAREAFAQHLQQHLPTAASSIQWFNTNKITTKFAENDGVHYMRSQTPEVLIPVDVEVDENNAECIVWRNTRSRYQFSIGRLPCDRYFNVHKHMVTETTLGTVRKQWKRLLEHVRKVDHLPDHMMQNFQFALDQVVLEPLESGDVPPDAGVQLAAYAGADAPLALDGDLTNVLAGAHQILNDFENDRVTSLFGSDQENQGPTGPFPGSFPGFARSSSSPMETGPSAASAASAAAESTYKRRRVTSTSQGDGP